MIQGSSFLVQIRFPVGCGGLGGRRGVVESRSVFISGISRGRETSHNLPPQLPGRIAPSFYFISNHASCPYLLVIRRYVRPERNGKVQIRFIARLNTSVYSRKAPHLWIPSRVVADHATKGGLDVKIRGVDLNRSRTRLRQRLRRLLGLGYPSGHNCFQRSIPFGDLRLIDKTVETPQDRNQCSPPVSTAGQARVYVLLTVSAARKAKLIDVLEDASPRSASCCESYAIRHNVPG